jgi:6-phospho-beta-glucosidase
MDELALLDIDPERLEVVGALAERMLSKVDWSGRLVRTGDRDAALEGADFVIVQLRVGGQQARYLDETIPLRFGCIGQETTGPGGFAKALRTVPLVLELAEETECRGAPGAWFVDFTNPTGLVTQALLDAGHRALGLCNVAIGFQRRFAERFGVEPSRVELEHVGLNHLTWERAVRIDGRDVLTEMLGDDVAAGALAEELEFPVELLRGLRALPSYYLRYFYRTSEMLARERSGHTRAIEVMEIERGLLELYRDPKLDVKPALLEERGGAFYSEAAAQLMASLHAGTGDVQVVNVRNDGALPDLPADDVVEVPARIDHEGAHPLPMEPLAAEMRGLVQHVKAYERLTVEAALSGDRTIALRALLSNPLVGEWAVAVPLLDALLEANRPYLPRFFPSTAG